MSNTITDHESHQVNASTTHIMLKRKTYDHRNRLLSTTITLNNGTPATVTYAYNELGQLQTKKLGNASTIANQYNIQGWLTSQSSSKFSLGLDYFSTGRRDGNIAKLNWGQSSATDQFYTLNYDKFGRMTAGVHSLSKFNETIGSYDLNGNIKSLTRTANGSTSDNFTYTYSGNRLTNLSGITGTYTYDDSGNLTNDPRKNLNFTWNSLNLLKEVKSGSTVKAQYLYSYDGAKVKVQDSGNTNGYDYLGSLTLVKTNNTLTPEHNFGEGMIKGNEVMYFEKDHLGSIRSVLNNSGTVIEKNDYYPFGQRHANSSYVVTANNRFKFNGKEDQTVGSLGLLDYGARMYDGYIGRWLGSDPMAYAYYATSPYVYCSNNPINRIDPIGMLDDEWRYNIDTDELINVGSRGGNEEQHVTIESNDDEFGQVTVHGASVYIVKLRDAVAVTNYDTGIPRNYNQKTGYVYSAKDFYKRKQIVNSGSNPIKTYIYQMERERKAEPIHADEYWDILGTSLGNFYAGSMFVQMSLDLIPGPSFNSSPKGFASKTSFKPAEVTTAKELTSWQ